MPDNLSRYRVPLNPMPVPEPLPEGEEQVLEQQIVEESKPGWNWVGSPSRPEAQRERDGISDLFRVTPADVGASAEDLADLTNVDVEKDIVDAGEDGTLNDLVDVTRDDIMGNELGQRPSKPASRQPRTRRRITPRYLPPTSMRRSG